MDNIKKHLPMIIIIALELAVGILLFINPELFTKAMSIIIGIALIALGIFFLVRIFTGRETGPMSWLAIVISVVAMTVGVFCTFFFESVLAVVGVFYGIMLVIAAIVKVKVYLDLNREGVFASPIRLIGAFISLVLGVLMLINPFKVMQTFWIFTGIALIVQAAVDIVTLVLKIKTSDDY